MKIATLGLISVHCLMAAIHTLAALGVIAPNAFRGLSADAWLAFANVGAALGWIFSYINDLLAKVKE